MDNFFEKTTKLSSDFEPVVIKLDRDLVNRFAFDGVQMQRLDRNKCKYKIIIEQSMDLATAKPTDPLLKAI